TDGVKLNRCYAYDTADSGLAGQAEQDAVLSQQGNACSPQAAIPQQSAQYVLEGTQVTLALLFGEGIDRAAISNGQALIDDVPQPFDWSTGTIVMPAQSGSGVADGAKVF